MVREIVREMNDRTCIVTRETREPDELIRFVAGPDGIVVPDLKRVLPGRGCWVTATREAVDKAAKKKLFARALKREASAPADLGAAVDGLLARNALGSLGLARKAGAVALGGAKVDGAVRSAKAFLVLHAREAAGDGVRKIGQARRATAALGGPEIDAWKLFGEAEMSLALGGANVIHAAVLGAGQGRAVEKRLEALHRYRGSIPDHRMTVEVPGDGWAGEGPDDDWTGDMPDDGWAGETPDGGWAEDVAGAAAKDME